MSASPRVPALVAIATLLPTGAQAHHAMDGALVQTPLQGLLSGLAHPVIGPDHLVFLLAVGLVAGLSGLGWRVAAAFIASGVVGVLVRVGGVEIALEGVLVALTMVLVGVALAAGADVDRRPWLGVFAAAGLIHGYAFGESIVGAERDVLASYLVGLGIAQAVMLGAIVSLLGWVGEREDPMARQVRLRSVGRALAVVGACFLMLGLVPA